MRRIVVFVRMRVRMVPYNVSFAMSFVTMSMAMAMTVMIFRTPCLICVAFDQVRNLVKQLFL